MAYAVRFIKFREPGSSLVGTLNEIMMWILPSQLSPRNCLSHSKWGLKFRTLGVPVRIRQGVTISTNRVAFFKPGFLIFIALGTGPKTFFLFVFESNWSFTTCARIE